MSGEAVTARSAWAGQPLIWTERVRGRALLWPAGDQWFVNDPLGPMPHTHPDASEIYYVAGGVLDLTVGATELTIRRGGVVLIPPDTFHHPVNAGPEDLCLFVAVAPNWRGQRWKPEGFVESDYRGRPTTADTSSPGPLPGEERLRTTVLDLPAGEGGRVEVLPAADRVLYVLSGSVLLRTGPLEGRLGAHEYFSVASGVPHAVQAAEGRARVLSIVASAPGSDALPAPAGRRLQEGDEA